MQKPALWLRSVVYVESRQGQYDDRDHRVATNLRFSVLQSANAGLFVAYNEVDEHGLREPRQELILKYSRIIDWFG